MDQDAQHGPAPWSGLAIDDREYERLVREHGADIPSNGALDPELAAEVLDASDRLAHTHRRELEHDDSVPFLAHSVLAFGDRPVGKTSLLGRLGEFVSAGALAQANAEGDFHPWQSFAYALLAAVPVDATLTKAGDTLLSVIHRSTDLNVDSAEELGHPLLVLGLLATADRPQVVRFQGKDTSTELLVGHAIRAHYLGHFEVCRKFHLTEGILLAVAQQPELRSYAAYPAEFVDGQMRVLKLLAVLLRLIVTRPVAKQELIARLQDALRLGAFLENHLFYAGHLLELAGIADTHGYYTPRPWLNSVINDMNSLLLGGSLSGSRSLRSILVQMSHYRRALISWNGVPGGCGAPAAPPRERVPWPGASAEEPQGPRRRFVEVLDAYERLRSRQPGPSPVSQFRLRGTFAHFRRAHGVGWPKQIHYEILDYGHCVGVELHCESPDLGEVAGVIRCSLAAVEHIAADRIDWDPTWWQGSGRLRLRYSDNRRAEEIAEGLASLIESTYAPLQDACGLPSCIP